jgi:azurin
MKNKQYRNPSDPSRKPVPLLQSLVVAVFFAATFFIASASGLSAADCKLTIKGNDQMQFDVKEIRVPKECKEFELTLIHSGKLPFKTMGHNWVLAKESDWRSIAIEEAKRFPKSPDDIPTDKRIIAQTTFVGGAAGDTKQAKTTVKVSALSKSTNYQYFCSFPGHFALMTGKFILEK